MSFSRILITGVNGFFGKHLSTYLLENYPSSEITGIDINKSHGPFRFKFMISDITDYDSIKKTIIKTQPNIVFHLAGTFNQEDLKLLYKTNVIGTENLMKASTFLTEKTRIILSSSAAVYGFVTSENNPIKENTEIRPINHYGISKAAMEMTGYMYGKEQNNIEIITARTFNLVGYGLSPLLLPGKLAKKIKEGAKTPGEKKIRVGNINTIRDFCDIKDAVKAFAFLAFKGKKNNVYNIGSGVGRKIKDFIDTFMMAFDIEGKVIIDRKLFKERDPKKIVADISKIKIHTGWEPKITLEESVLNIIKHNLI